MRARLRLARPGYCSAPHAELLHGTLDRRRRIRIQRSGDDSGVHRTHLRDRVKTVAPGDGPVVVAWTRRATTERRDRPRASPPRGSGSRLRQRPGAGAARPPDLCDSYNRRRLTPARGLSLTLRLSRLFPLRNPLSPETPVGGGQSGQPTPTLGLSWPCPLPPGAIPWDSRSTRASRDVGWTPTRCHGYSHFEGRYPLSRVNPTS